MKPRWPALPLAPALALVLGGCVLPIPTTQVAAPSVQGRVIHANTGQPVDLAGVTVEGFKEASVLTRRDGHFATEQITRTRPFWVWWPFGGDPAKEVTLRVARPGFGKAKQKVAWHPKTQPHVYLSQPIALEPKSPEKLAEEAREKLSR